jgi:hypothetical protein
MLTSSVVVSVLEGSPFSMTSKLNLINILVLLGGGLPESLILASFP